MTAQYRVLYIGTANAARSIIAEALTQTLGLSRFQGFSAGTEPAAAVDGLILERLAAMHVSVAGLSPKPWQQFVAPHAPQMDFIVTLSEEAARLALPAWPGQPVCAHWALPDPLAPGLSNDEKRRAVKDTATALRRRIELLMSLPLARLDRAHLAARLAEIGEPN